MVEKRRDVIRKVRNRLKEWEAGKVDWDKKMDDLSEELAILVKRVERVRSIYGISEIELSPYVSTMIKLVGNIEIADEVEGSRMCDVM